MDFSYHVVDVFTSVPLQGGNPHAVFPVATALDTGTMQRIARELNLPETSFVIPEASNDRRTRVRIFTPDAELPFAGVPTIGAAHVLRTLGIVPRSSKNLVIEENIGEVAVRVDDGEDPVIWLTSPPLEQLAEYPRERAVFEQIVKDRSTPTQLFVFAAVDTGAYSRMFGPQIGVAEDPATGSATGPLAAFMMKHGLARGADGTRFVSEQGTQMGRQSFLHVHVHGDKGAGGIEVGGHVAPLAKGVMRIPARSSVSA